VAGKVPLPTATCCVSPNARAEFRRCGVADKFSYVSPASGPTANLWTACRLHRLCRSTAQLMQRKRQEVVPGHLKNDLSHNIVFIPLGQANPAAKASSTHGDPELQWIGPVHAALPGTHRNGLGPGQDWAFKFRWGRTLSRRPAVLEPAKICHRVSRGPHVYNPGGIPGPPAGG
jgi:hypothetical protein